MSNIPNAPQTPSWNQRDQRSIDLDQHTYVHFSIDDNEVDLQIDSEADRQRIIAAAACQVDLRQLLSLPSDDRKESIVFLHEIQTGRSGTTISLGDSVQQTDLFSAAKDLLRATDRNNPAFDKALDVAHKVAALQLTDRTNLTLGCNAILEILKLKGVTGFRADRLAKDAQEFRREVCHPAATSEGNYVQAIWPDAPCDANLVVPSAWSAAEGEITSDDGMDVFPCPVVVIEITEDIEDGSFSIKLAWKQGAQWRERQVSKEQVSSKQRVVELSKYGLPVTSNNAAVLIDYLADFENENLETIPKSRVTHRQGWFNENGQPGFMLGQRYITEDTVDASEVGELQFLGDDDGDSQIASGFHQEGSLETWLDAIRNLQHLDRVMLAIYASLCASLVHILRCPNFVVSYDGRTSSGKSTVQAVAASCWGNPTLNGQAGNSVVHGWDATRVFTERAASISNDLPLILDDTKVARNQDEITNTIYQYVNGGGRGRGSQQGIAVTRTWRGVMISSGEDPITSFSRNGGSRARVLGLWGSPFGNSENAGQLVVTTREQLELNYGHAGPRFIEYLLNNRQLWQVWIEWYRENQRRYQQRAGDNAIAGRMGSAFAALELAAYLAHQAIFDWEYTNAVGNLWQEITAGTEEADPGVAAMQFIIGWAESNKAQFQGGGSHGDIPARGWLGAGPLPRVPADRRKSEDLLAIHTHVLDGALKERGFSPDAIKKLWQDAGWLQTDRGRQTKKIRIDGTSVAPMVAIRRAVINEMMVDTEEQPIERPPRCRPGT